MFPRRLRLPYSSGLVTPHDQTRSNNPAPATAGSSESIWGMMAIVAVTWEAASEESWEGQGVGSVAPSVFGALRVQPLGRLRAHVMT